jgi:hypothetical protein
MYSSALINARILHVTVHDSSFYDVDIFTRRNGLLYILLRTKNSWLVYETDRPYTIEGPSEYLGVDNFPTEFVGGPVPNG